MCTEPDPEKKNDPADAVSVPQLAHFAGVPMSVVRTRLAKGHITADVVFTGNRGLNYLFHRSRLQSLVMQIRN